MAAMNVSSAPSCFSARAFAVSRTSAASRVSSSSTRPCHITATNGTSSVQLRGPSVVRLVTRRGTAERISGGSSARRDVASAAVALSQEHPSAAETSGKRFARTSLAVGAAITVAAVTAIVLPEAALAAAKKAAAVVAVPALPYLPFTHDQILLFANYAALPAWASLIFLPRWSFSRKLTLATIMLFSALYAALAFSLFTVPTAPPSMSGMSSGMSTFNSIASLSKLFADSSTMLAGWCHYIVFDLFVARWMVMDAPNSNIPHLAIVPCLLGNMLFGPTGLLLYLFVRKFYPQSPFATKVFKFKN